MPPPNYDEYIGGGYQMLSSRNIFNNELNFNNVREIDKEGFEKEDKRTDVSDGDILLTIVGTIGRSLVLRNMSKKFALQRSVAVIKPIFEEIYPEFLAFLLQSDKYQKVLNDNSQGVAQKGIYLNQLKELNIYLPSIEIQKEIVEKLEHEKKVIEGNKELIKIYENKINARINKVWSDN